MLLAELGLAIGTADPVNLLTQSAAASGQTLVITIGANPPTTITFGTNNGAGEVSTLGELSTALAGISGGLGSINTANGNITISAANLTDTITVGGTASAVSFGIHKVTALPANGTVIADDLSAFLECTVGGGAVTCYDDAGSPVNIQLRWAKIKSAAYGDTDTWNLFYQTDSNATGTQVAWRNAGVDYKFAANGQLDPEVANLTLPNVVVNGISLGNLQIAHGTGGITQFADPNGNAQVNLLQQNGFPAGSLQEVSVNDKGRVVGAYSNGRTIDIAEITLANFNGANYLKRIDGGAFEVTDESGPAIFGTGGKIIGSSLEGSNTDIADEFTKLIVTQQAYSANTRVISTSNQMVQDLLNMLR
jgi:flagellar hook protein FlgE